jgi:hypothetical protein
MKPHSRAIPSAGDRIVVERSDGLFDVMAVNDSGVEELGREDLSRFAASEIAAAGKNYGGHVWSRHHLTPQTVKRFRF